MRPHLALRAPTLAPARAARPVPPPRAAPGDDQPTTSTATTDRPAVGEQPQGAKPRDAQAGARKGFGLGDLLGPIGLTVGKSAPERDVVTEKRASFSELGPIGITVGPSVDGPAAAALSSTEDASASPGESVSTLTTAEWRAKYEPDGCVDLWVEEEFNAGSRLVGGRAAHFGRTPGAGSGEGATGNAAAAKHAVRIVNKATGQDIEVTVPEDRYVLWEAEDQGLLLPYACRMGCCTACAVRVKEGTMTQPEALGVAAELRARGFALMCVGYAQSDLVLEVAGEDEVYDLQFGAQFEEAATNPNGAAVMRDDFALEIANMDE